MTSNINAQSCSNLCNNYSTVFKNHCLSMLHSCFVFNSFVVVDCHLYLFAWTTMVWLLLMFWSIHTLNIVEKQLSVHGSQWLIDFCPFHSFGHQEMHCCMSLVQMFSGADIFMPCPPSRNRLQLNHTHSISQFDCKLQLDKVSAEHQQKYFFVALTFWIFFIIIECNAKFHQIQHFSIFVYKNMTLNLYSLCVMSYMHNPFGHVLQ